jgi:hypothetical protein
MPEVSNCDEKRHMLTDSLVTVTHETHALDVSDHKNEIQTSAAAQQQLGCTHRHHAALTFRHCQKTKQMAGFHRPFVDSPHHAGFTLSGLWGAPSVMWVGVRRTESPARRTHAMTQKSAVVCAMRLLIFRIAQSGRCRRP